MHCPLVNIMSNVQLCYCFSPQQFWVSVARIISNACLGLMLHLNPNAGMTMSTRSLLWLDGIQAWSIIASCTLYIWESFTMWMVESCFASCGWIFLVPPFAFGRFIFTTTPFLALSVVFNSWPYISAMLLHPVSQATQVRPQSSMSSLKHWASASAGGWLPMLFRCLVEIKKTDQGFDPLVDVLVSLQTCMGSIHGKYII